MASSTDTSSDEPQKLDLDQLKDFDFGPSWSGGSSRKSSVDAPARESSGPRSSGPRDRRPARKTTGPRKERRAPERAPAPFEPVVAFSIYPEDEPFDLLTESIRSSLKVYELFEVTRLILDKPDRMVAVVSPLSDEAPPLYECLADHQVFTEEAAALRHAALLALTSRFEEREEEVDPPSGAFQSVMRCGITGRLLPPRSYHRFHALLAEHHRLHCSDKPITAVEKSLQSVPEPEAVEEWLSSMRKRTVFRLRKPGDAGPAEPAPAEVSADSAESSPVEAPAEAKEVPAPADKPEEGEDAAESSVGPSSEEAAPAGEAQPDDGGAEEAPTAGEAQPDEGGAEEAPTAGEAPVETGRVFGSREEAIQYLLMEGRDGLVRQTRQARVPGKALAEAVDEAIRKSFEAYVEKQKRFPLETANNVRMKLRKAKFFLFKRGKKGISYLAAVRRKSRPSDAVFTDSAEKIIRVIEGKPGIRLKELPGLIHPDRVGEDGKVALQPDETRQLVNDLKWLKSEGYLYEFGDGTLEMQPVESTAPPKKKTEGVEATVKTPVETAGGTEQETETGHPGRELEMGGEAEVEKTSRLVDDNAS